MLLNAIIDSSGTEQRYPKLVCSTSRTATNNNALSVVNDLSVSLPFLSHTVPRSFAQCAQVARYTIRGLVFWRRVLTIWATFKLTQMSVSLQRPFRKPNWPARAWSSQHRRAADVGLSFIPLYLFVCLSMHIYAKHCPF